MYFNFLTCLFRFQIFLFFVSCLLISSFTSFGQGTFLDGYIISPKGDTTKGFIRYLSWNASPVSIDYSPDKSGNDFRKLDDEYVIEFYIPSVGERFKSRKVGVLDIDLSQSYRTAPSLETKDSLTAFLREIAHGPNASLFVLTTSSKVTKYFLEKNHAIVELKNYSYNRIIGEKKYLVVFDDYKRQLPLLLADSKNFDEPIPQYDQKGLKKYVEKYNQTFGEKPFKSEAVADEPAVLLDLYLGGGIEQWDEYFTKFKYKLATVVGLRISFPRNFQNRYARFSFQMIHGVASKDVKFGGGEGKAALKSLEAGFGTYMGYKKIRPYAGLDFSYPLGEWRSIILGPHIGIGFRRQFNIELSHFFNLYPLMTGEKTVNGARISFNYYIDLNRLLAKKSYSHFK